MALTVGEKATSWMLNHLSLPYLLGGNGPHAWDCSGSVEDAWKFATDGKLVLPHYAAWQYWLTSRVFHKTADHPNKNSIGALRAGDLVFYEWNPDKTGPRGEKGGPDHVAMFLGDYHGHRWVAQFTAPGINSEVIPIDYYVPHLGFGRVKFGVWWKNRKHEHQFGGHGINRSRFANYL